MVALSLQDIDEDGLMFSFFWRPGADSTNKRR